MTATTLTLTLLDGRARLSIDGVVSLQLEDASGQFGIWPRRQALVSVLEPGLFRYRRESSQTWLFGAGCGGLVDVAAPPHGDQAQEVRMVSRRFLLGEDPQALQEQLSQLLQREHHLRLSTRDRIEQLDLALLRKMQGLGQGLT